jgi:nitrate reductase delta subunit
MSTTDVYQALAAMIAYPRDRQELLDSYAVVARHLQERGLTLPTAPFGETVTSSSLAELQETYVALFDFNAALAPYLGHHLYGDNQKKGAYLIDLKGEFRRFDFTPASNELPDHLEILLRFLAHLDQHERPAFLRSQVLAGLHKLEQAFAQRSDCPWAYTIAATGAICAADCEEVTSC